jgi:hypothetical protein
VHGTLSSRLPRAAGQTRRRQIRGGQRRAAVQAFTAAKLWMGKPIAPSTQAEAAVLTGTNAVYLIAAATLLRHGDSDLIADVVVGHVGLLRAAATVKKRVRLVRAYQDAGPDDLVAFGRQVGPQGNASLSSGRSGVSWRSPHGPSRADGAWLSGPRCESGLLKCTNVPRETR